MNPFKESITFYSRNIEHLLLLSVTILLPFLTLQTLTSNYVYLWMAFSPTNFFGDIVNVFYMLLFFVVAQLPFIQFVQSDLEGEEHRLLKSYRTFWEYGFSVFLFGIPYVLFVIAGSFLFIVPGLILLVLFFLTPYFVVIKKQPSRKCWKEAFKLAKMRFLPLAGLLLLISTVEWIVSIIGMYGVGVVTTSYGAILFTQIILNMVLFPFIAVLLTVYVRKWRSETSKDQYSEAEQTPDC